MNGGDELGHTMMNDPNKSERPRADPEILPPDRRSREAPWRQPAWRPYFSHSSAETHRVYVASLGPLGVVLLILIVGVFAVAALVAVLGAVLIWVPVLVLLLAAGAIFRILRR